MDFNIDLGSYKLRLLDWRKEIFKKSCENLSHLKLEKCPLFKKFKVKFIRKNIYLCCLLQKKDGPVIRALKWQAVSLEFKFSLSHGHFSL